MRTLLSLSAAALLLSACGSELDPNAARDALPKKEVAQIGTPEAEPASGSATALHVATSGTAADRSYGSEYARTSFWTAVTVNGGVAFTLDLLQAIVAFQPSSCDTDSCTWGPWTGEAGNAWTLRVEKRGDGGYDYALSARSAVDGASVTVLEGTAYAGADRNHGYGAFSIDFDAQDLLAHADSWQKKDFGTLTVSYDNRTTIQVDATLTNGRNDEPGNEFPMNAVYAFDRTPGHGGELQLALENLATDESVSLRTRWNADGAGRGDVRYLVDGAGEIDASECWAGQAYGFVEVYDTKPEPDFGAVEACAPEFSVALYADVTLP